jgi:hypothetical protein
MVAGRLVRAGGAGGDLREPRDSVRSVLTSSSVV